MVHAVHAKGSERTSTSNADIHGVSWDRSRRGSRWEPRSAAQTEDHRQAWARNCGEEEAPMLLGWKNDELYSSQTEPFASSNEQTLLSHTT